MLEPEEEATTEEARAELEALAKEVADLMRELLPWAWVGSSSCLLLCSPFTGLHAQHRGGRDRPCA